MAVRYLTKEQMVEKLKSVKDRGWIKSIRPLNSGGIGNTIDALLGLPENNLPIADTAQWELKSHRVGSSSLLTLFHMEPQPRDCGIVVNLLLPNYGWPHDKAGTKYPNDEMSFRQTLRAHKVTDRGFGILVDDQTKTVRVYFDSSKVHSRHSDWLEGVEQKIGLGLLIPEPYWNRQELFLKASTKLLNSFYVEANSKKEGRDEYFEITKVLVLQNLDIGRFSDAMNEGAVLVDFDARTHHNHGTKIRLRQNWIPNLYLYAESVL